VVDPLAPAAFGANKYSLQFGIEERAKIFMNFIIVLCKSKDFDKAKKIMAKAIAEFSETSE
jgi:hypothetical protein